MNDRRRCTSPYVVAFAVVASLLAGGREGAGLAASQASDSPPKPATAEGPAPAEGPREAPVDPLLTTSAPEGYETFVDDQGRKYFVVTAKKRPGQFVRVGTTHVQLTGGYVLEILSEDDQEFRLKKYLSTGERAAPIRVKAPPPDPVAIARSYEISLPESDRLRFSAFDRGLPRSGQWRNGFDVGDLDGDGRLEIVFGPARKGRAVPSLFRQDGDGGWSADGSRSFPRQRLDYGDAKIADWNGDGRLDLAFGMHLLGIVAWIDDGEGRYAPWSRGIDVAAPGGTTDGVFSSRALRVADWNRDGKPDLIALGDGPRMQSVQPGAAPKKLPAANGLVVHVNRGDGSWEVRRDDSPANAQAFGDSLAVADLDRDGDLDAAIAARQVGRRDLLALQQADGSIAWAELAALRPRTLVDAVAAADLDRDGWQDLVVGYRSNEMVWRYGLDIHWGGAGGWTRQGLAVREGNDAVLALAVGDLDGDGAPDVAAFPRATEPWLFLGGSGRVLARELVTAEELGTAGDRCAGFAARIADLDGDGRGELVAAFAGDPGANDPFGLTVAADCPSGGSLRVWRSSERVRSGSN